MRLTGRFFAQVVDSVKISRKTHVANNKFSCAAPTVEVEACKSNYQIDSRGLITVKSNYPLSSYFFLASGFARNNICNSWFTCQRRGLSTGSSRFQSNQPAAVRKKGFPENWGSKRKARPKPIRIVYDMATDEKIEEILAPLRAAVKEQVSHY